jgi:hypothetical protein
MRPVTEQKLDSLVMWVCMIKGVRYARKGTL